MKHLKSNQPRPFLRWAGSKQKLLPKLISICSRHYERYVEPFMGSACFFFRLQPAKALLSDINGELINTFLAVRDQPAAVHHEITLLPPGKKAYYFVRSANPAPLSIAQRAARFIYLNRFCFNGLYRTNRAGQFNVPYGGGQSGSLPSEADLLQSATVLRHATIQQSDFENILLSEVRRGDFVYLDPPFAVTNRRVFREYAYHTFGPADLERLRSALCSLDRRGVPFVLSYAECSEAKMFDRWNVRRVYVQRNISGFARHRRKSAEVLVTSFKTP